MATNGCSLYSLVLAHSTAARQQGYAAFLMLSCPELAAPIRGLTGACRPTRTKTRAADA